MSMPRERTAVASAAVRRNTDPKPKRSARWVAVLFLDGQAVEFAPAPSEDIAVFYCRDQWRLEPTVIEEPPRDIPALKTILANDEPVTVIKAKPTKGEAIPPPPPGFVSSNGKGGAL